MVQRFLVGIGILNLCAIIILSTTVFTNSKKVVYVDSPKLLNINTFSQRSSVESQKDQRFNTDDPTVFNAFVLLGNECDLKIKHRSPQANGTSKAPSNGH